MKPSARNVSQSGNATVLKLACFPVLLVVAYLSARHSGALRNKISHTVVSDYFHALEFLRFRTPQAKKLVRRMSVSR